MNKTKKIKIISSLISFMGLAIGIANTPNINIEEIKALNNNIKNIVDVNNAIDEIFNITPEGGAEIKCTVLTDPTVEKNGTVSVQGISGKLGRLIIPELVIHNGNTYDVTTIPENGFSNFDAYQEYTDDLIIPKSIISIGKSAFDNTRFTTSKLKIFAEASILPESCFLFCWFSDIEIMSTKIPTRIEAECFNQNNITKIILPSNITSLSENAFHACSSLKKVYLLSKTLIPYEGNPFFETDLGENLDGEIFVRPELVDQYKSSTGWPYFSSIIFPISVDSIDLDQTNIKADLDDEQPIKLNATVKGEYQGLDWSSSNEKIVSVDRNGQLTYNGVGKATIKVESDGDSTKFATCEIEITEPEPQPEPEKPSNNLALILGLSLGLGIPIVVGIGFGTYYFINKNKKQ